MPDTMIMAAAERPAKLSTAAEMTALWKVYQESKDAFEAAIRLQDNGTPETADVFERAQRAIMDARTVDAAGVAIKLKVAKETCNFEAVGDVIEDLEAANRADRGGQEPLVMAWFDFERAEAAQKTACDAYSEAETTSFAKHPLKPDGDLTEWRAACDQVNAEHDLPALSRKQDKASDRYGKALRKITEGKPTTTLGLLIQILVDNDADNLIDEFAEEAGIDARKAIGDLVRQLADQTAPLSNYRR